MRQKFPIPEGTGIILGLPKDLHRQTKGFGILDKGGGFKRVHIDQVELDTVRRTLFGG